MNSVGGITVSWDEVEGAVKYVVYRRAVGAKKWDNIKSTTEKTYLDKSAKNNTTYYYFVKAVNSSSVYSVYDSSKVSKIKCVDTPTLTKIQNTTAGVRIDWNKVPSATGYHVYKKEGNVDYWTYLGSTKNLKYVDSSTKNKSAVTYQYTVRAENGVYSGFNNTGLSDMRLCDPIMKSASSSKTGVTVKWGSVKGAEKYNVYRKTADSGWVRLAVVKGMDNVTYVDKTAKKGVTYVYTARAVCSNHISAYSSTISCKDKY
jgi:fibronectin type 3 domain-containing protein